jgi:sulfite reductase (NADPH) hemoprotein beta-component
VTLSLKRLGQAPGDVTDGQMEQAADIADRFSSGELRVTHDQNLLLLGARGRPLRPVASRPKQQLRHTQHRPADRRMIACPGGDFCSLANARSIPIAAAIAERFRTSTSSTTSATSTFTQSGCMNSCGHHHSAGTRHPRCRQGWRRVVPDHARRSDGTVASRAAYARQGHRPVVCRR